jgi:lipopolysaccharide transport system ATP-binding protein
VSRIAISIAGLRKAYRLWPRPHDLLVEALTGRRRHVEFVALDDVSLDVAAGTVLGVLGRNGAGKSTLLRIVAGTLDATAGSVRVDGRVAAILELGTGFHPEYTGRENVLLGGMCLGMSRAEVAAKLDGIVTFAELEEFIDRPLRTYSSGMQARLAFAVATAVDPDVLIIDEALSVGDARFQLKSFDRIRRFKQEGRTILFVSHSIQTVVAICDRAVLLERGRIIADGEPNEVGNLYHEMLFGPGKGAQAETMPVDAGTAGGCPTSDEPSDPKPPPGHGREMRYGAHAVEISRVGVVDRHGLTTTRLHSGETYEVRLELVAHAATGPLHYGVLLRDTKGFEIFGWDTGSAGLPPRPGLAAGERREHRLRFRCALAGGTYFLTAALAREDGTKEDVRFDAVQIVVAPTPELHTSSLVNLDMTDVSIQTASAHAREEMLR